MKLYPYQNEAVTHAVNEISERGNSLIVAGTGAGKTIMMAAAIGRYFDGFCAEHNRRPHVLVLVHRTEIHSQNHKKFSLVCPHIATSEITSARKSLKGNIHFGMVATVLNLMSELERSRSFFDLIVIDEAHHAKASSYEEIINRNKKGNPNASILGVTATPNRGDKLPLIHLFDNYYQITTRFLIESHYLTRPTFKDHSPVFNVDGELEKGHLGKNIRNDSAGDKLLDELIDTFIKVKEPGKSIIFCPSHAFCQRVYDKLKTLGHSPAYLSSGIDDITRREELRRFEEGDCEELINVDICTEGYDFPALRNLVDFDTNGTHGQWVQKVGRVLRTAPGKTSCTVIDFGGNCELYPDGVDTDVLLEGAQKKKRGELLCERDFYRRDNSGRKTEQVIYRDNDIYTPYHLPEGFESVNDKDFGIVFVACGEKSDCIIVGEGCISHKNDKTYTLYVSDKKTLRTEMQADFDKCITMAVAISGEIEVSDRPISNMQIKLLAPQYPTTALGWHGANCCICWKTWKECIKNGN